MLKYIYALSVLLIMNNSIVFGQTAADSRNSAITADSYRIFESSGKPAKLDNVIEKAGQSEVLFLGEQHDDAVAHFLQAEIFRLISERFGRQKKLALSVEMFERDTQLVLNEYLDDLITEKKFLDDSRPWGNYQTDYRPLVEYAKANHLPVIAANAPRRYVNMVSRGGRSALEKLSPAAKNLLAPLPYAEASAAYTNKFNNLMGGMTDPKNPHNPLLASQSLWDATMANSIAKFLTAHKNPLVVQLNGSFHSENHLGIVEHLEKYRRAAKSLVVTMLYADDFKTFDASKMKNLGDFIILTDAKVPRSGK